MILKFKIFESVLNNKIFYHGSAMKIENEKFRPTKSERSFGTKVKNNVYFFTPNKELAELFAKYRASESSPFISSLTNGKGVITKVHLNVTNILDLSEDADFVMEFFEKLFPSPEFLHTDEFDNEIDLTQIWTWLDEPDVVNKIKSMGYDAVKLSEPMIYGTTSIAVFDPDKIKIIGDDCKI